VKYPKPISKRELAADTKGGVRIVNVHKRDATSRYVEALQLKFALENPRDPAVIGRNLRSMRAGDEKFWAMVKQHRARERAKAEAKEQP
jgi:hypothetical protein